MKIKRSMKERTCSNPKCQRLILKGQHYAQESKTILFDSEGQSFDEGRTWSEFRVIKKLDFCSQCISQKEVAA